VPSTVLGFGASTVSTENKSQPHPGHSAEGTQMIPVCSLLSGCGMRYEGKNVAIRWRGLRDLRLSLGDDT
jgi:hypothetical protein